MKKLALDLDSLSVTSFSTDAAKDKVGTVQGHDDVPTNPWCIINSYQSYCPNTLCTCPPPVD
jgi:hypothetical protein